MTAMLDLEVKRCHQCGKADDHPKHLYGLDVIDPATERVLRRAPVWHHDCVPFEVQREMLVGAHSEHPLVYAKILKAAQDGVHGDELRELITTFERPADYGDAEMILAVGLANAITDAVFNNGSSGTVVIGALSLALPFRLKFLSTVSTQAAAGSEWSTSGGYTAGGVSLAGLFTTAAALGSKSNTGAISVTNAPAGTWADNEVQDSTGTPVRMVAKGSPSLAKTVNLGDTCTVPISNLTGTFA